MKQKKVWLIGAAVLALTFVVNCSEKKSAATNALIVVFVSGEPKVVKAGAESPLKVGMVVSVNDIIKTEANTFVDLQTKGGSAIRVKEFTTITVSKLAEGAETSLKLEQGGLLASVKRSSAKEEFKVITPTAIAGVRGTTFSVNVDPFENKSTVKVIDGKVAMAPRVAALEGYTAEEIKADPTLSKLAEIETSKEIILEERTEGSLDPKVEKQVADVSAAMIEAKADNKDATKGIEVKAMIASFDKNEATDVMKKEESEVTQAEMIEKSTLITVDADSIEELASNPQDAEVTEKLRQERDSRQEQILKQIEDEASKKGISSEKEIKQQYAKLEALTLNSGEVVRGAVVAQAGDVLIFHTANGVRRFKKSEVVSQDFAQ